MSMIHVENGGQVKSSHQGLNIIYLGTFEYKMILLLTFCSFLSAGFFLFFLQT